MAAEANRNLESYAKHHTNVFDSLRQSIKKEGKMFLFGEPTDNMIKLLLKIYHENILRTANAYSTNVAGTSKKLKCMFGVMEDDKGDLYVTISESPGVKANNLATDPDYKNKREMVLNLMKSAKVTLQFPERDKSLPLPVSSNVSLWRKGERGGVNTDTIYKVDELREIIKSKAGLKEAMLYNEDETDKQNIYDKTLRDLEITANWVDSYEYLTRRADKQATFRPFKKYKFNDKSSTWKAECNNGHLCTESKLFAYAKLNGLTPVSFVAYWIGDNTPPEDHIIRSYCYRTVVKPGDNPEEVAAETEKLEELTQQCEAPLNFPEVQDAANFHNVLKNTVQPIAVACPGCFANIDAYMKGNFTAWNYSNCYVPRRHAGGKRRTKRAKRSKRKTRRR